MNDDITAKVWAQLYPSRYEPYSLEDMLTRQPKFQAVDIEGLRQQYNKTVPEGKRFYPSPAVPTLENLQAMFDQALAETNARDVKKYFAPNSRIGPGSYGGASGHVSLNAPNDAYISPNTLNVASPKHAINTALHELAHSDHMTNDPQKRNLIGEVEPLNLSNFSDQLKAHALKKYFPASNAFDDGKEIRANLRASLGEQPYGTSAAQHFGPLLDALMSTGVSKDQFGRTMSRLEYFPRRATSGFNGVKVEDRDTLLKMLEMDLFPRERWLEPRKPTYKERIKDTYDALLNRFR